MPQSDPPGTGPSVPESRLFMDGDTLVLTLSPRPDLHQCSIQVLQVIDLHRDDHVQSVLIDCASLGLGHHIGLRCFIELGRGILSRQIHLLLLDASPDVHRKMADYLPEATWIDSCKGVYSELPVRACRASA